MKKNQTKAKIHAGETVFGTFVRFPDPTLVEVLGCYGWDFIIFDGEHGTIDPLSAEGMVRAAEVMDVTPVVRVPFNQQHTILRMMDTGAQGLQVPWVNTGAEAEAVIKSLKYGPRGIRGLAGVRANDYGQRGSLTDYVEFANRETMAIVHIETMTAVGNLDDILATPDLDVAFIGPTDLAHSLGFPGQNTRPEVIAVIDQIIDRCKERGVACGIQAANLETALHWKSRGARYITIQIESILRPAVQGYLKAVREA